MAGKGGREISRRIRAVKSIQQITKAMQLVAAANLRRAQARVTAARPYAGQLEAILHRLAGTGSVSHPLFEVRERRKVAYVVIASDRGYCGSYNINLIRKSAQVLRDDPAEKMLIAMGRRVRDFYARRQTAIAREYIGMPDDPTYSQARELTNELVKLFLDREVDEVRIVYTEFISALSQRQTEFQLLPVQHPEGSAAVTVAAAEGPAARDGDEEADPDADDDAAWEAAWAEEEWPDSFAEEDDEPSGPWRAPYVFEPDTEQVLGALLPKYVETQVYRVLLESKASEHGARMTAMSTATENATEMIDDLTLLFNRARQAAITQEISEIVGGAEALK